MKLYDTLRIIANFSCNQRCGFCYQKRWDNNFIEFSHIFKQLELYGLAERRLSEVFENVTILGGEPLVHPKIKQLIDHFAVEQSISNVRLNTNAKLLLDGTVRLDTLENLDTLTFDVGLGQTGDFEKDYEDSYNKILLAERLLNELPELKVKFNHIHYEAINPDLLHVYFRDFMNAVTRRIPSERLYVSVCQDVYSDPQKINMRTWAELTGGRIMSSHKLLDRVEYTSNGQTVVVAYMGDSLYANKSDFLIIWNDGSATNLKDYLKLTDCQKKVVDER